VKRRSLAILLAGAVALCNPISAAAANSDVKGMDQSEIQIEDESADSEGVIITDDAAEEASDNLDEILIEDEDASVDLTELDKDIKLNYRHFEGEEDFESVTDGAEDNEYNVIADKDYPSKYITPNLPSLRNQNPYGSCWAHATIALAEISLSQKGLASNPNFSELHMAYFTYNSAVDPLGGTEGDSNRLASGARGNFLEMGGNLDHSLHTLMTWQGAVDEATAPYSKAEDAINNGLSKDIAYKDVAHLENFFLEHYKNENEEINFNAIKELITRHGAVSISYQHANEAYYEKNNCYYNNGDYMGGGHAVAVVGWDDNYSKDNFSIKPEGNGAWLVRNSWFDPRYSEWGVSEYSIYGYFWMSYYDVTISDEVYAADFAQSSNYTYNYQYDGCMTGFGYPGSKFANVFTASGSGTAEAIGAVSFATESSNVHYLIRIYTGLQKDDNPESGALATTVSGVTDYAGYYTVKLPKPVSVSKGSKFSVVIEGTDSTRDFDLEFESTWQTNNWFDCVASAKQGQSFRNTGYGWKDMYTTGGNARIRAFTDDAAYVSPTGIKFDKASYDIKAGQDYKPLVTVSPDNATDKGYTLQSSDTKVVQVFEGVKLLGVAPGTATITAISNKGNFRATAKVTVTASYTFKITGEQNLLKGKEYTYKVEFTPSNIKETVVFSSSDTKVLTIDSKSGKAKAVGTGNAEVLATVGGVTAHFKVTVYPAALSVSFKVEPDNTISLLWQSTGADFYTVEDNGTVLATNIHADSKGACTYVDKRYAGKGNSQDLKIEYKVTASDNGWKTSVMVTVSLNKIFGITYVLNGGRNSEANPTYYTSATPTIKLAAPTKDRCTFAGWYRDSEYKTKITTIAKGSIGDITLYAKWISFTYNIKFNGNKATGSMKALKKCEFTETYQLPANNFKKKGYDFVGWNTMKDGTGRFFADGASVKELGSKKGETVTLYAQWKKITYSITYVLNGGINPSENPATFDVTTKTIKLQKPVREGYTFGGWFKQYKDDKFKSKASQISKGSAGNITLYAKWTMNKYNITFNGNKSNGGKMPKLKKCEYFTKYTLPENQFVKKGYVFTGWNTKKDGTGIAIKDKEDLYMPSFVIKNGQNITLYAQWKIEE
jgi:uncharacterized repeat protein (TIGR02543 family)